MDLRCSAIIYSLIAALSTFAGVQILVFRESFARRFSVPLVSFAAGVILSVAFLHLLPEAMELNTRAPLFILAGFLLFYFIESALIVHACPLHHCEGHGGRPKEVTGHIAFAGLFFHSFVDGLIIGVGFEVDETIGILTAISIILHKLPEGVSTFSILINAIPRKQALFRSYLEAMATPFGTAISLLFVHDVSKPVMGALLAVACGSFIYVAAADLIPETHEVRGFKAPACLVFGMLLIFGLSLLKH